jgi:hypothetical protein
MYHVYRFTHWTTLATNWKEHLLQTAQRNSTTFLKGLGLPRIENPERILVNTLLVSLTEVPNKDLTRCWDLIDGDRAGFDYIGTLEKSAIKNGNLSRIIWYTPS